MLGDNIIIKLEELTQTWLGWISCALTLEFQGCVFKSCLEWNWSLYFCYYNSGLNVKGWENPRGNGQPRELGKTTHNGP